MIVTRDWFGWIESRKQREERQAGSFALIAFLLNGLIAQMDFVRNVIRSEERLERGLGGLGEAASLTDST